MQKELILSQGGGIVLSDLGTVLISGPDAIDFLHRMTTVDLKKLGDRQAAWGASLNAKAGVLSLGVFERLDGSVRIHLAKSNIESTLEHLERFHFAENLSCRADPESTLFGIYRPKDISLPRAEPISFDWNRSDLYSKDGMVGWWDRVIPDFFWLRGTPEMAQAWIELSKGAGVAWGESDLFDALRIGAGLAFRTAEAGPGDIILEASATWAVARNKGCYPGQEVVERILTYGSVNRKLLPVEISGGRARAISVEKLRAALPIELEGIRLVSISKLLHPDGRITGLAYVHKAMWSRMEPWKTEAIEIALKIPR